MFKSSEVESFLCDLESKLHEVGIDLCSYYVDHLCYRVSTIERYNELRSELSKDHVLLHEAIISSRPIASFKMNTPFRYKNLEIPLLELPSPKPGSDYNEGFEHAEAVITTSFEEFSSMFPNVTFDWKGTTKSHNPELRIGFGNISIKLHHQSLEDVIKEELNL